MPHEPLHVTAKDAQGKEYIIRIHRPSSTVSTCDDPAATSEDEPRLSLEDGRSVARAGKGKYRIVGRGTVLTSDDPHAI